MQGKNHVALALSIPLGVALVTNQVDYLPPSALAWGGLILGSLAPDIDGGGTVAYWGNFLPRGITPRPLRSLLNWLGKTTSDVIRAIFGHRKAFHWPAFGVVMFAFGMAFNLPPVTWLGVGYCLHILGDSLTKSGVPLFGPLWTGDISFTPMITGSFTESAFGALLWLFVGWRLMVEFVPNSSWVWQMVYRFGGQFL